MCFSCWNICNFLLCKLFLLWRTCCRFDLDHQAPGNFKGCHPLLAKNDIARNPRTKSHETRVMAIIKHHAWKAQKPRWHSMTSSRDEMLIDTGSIDTIGHYTSILLITSTGNNRKKQLVQTNNRPDTFQHIHHPIPHLATDGPPFRGVQRLEEPAASHHQWFGTTSSNIVWTLGSKS